MATKNIAAAVAEVVAKLAAPPSPLLVDVYRCGLCTCSACVPSHWKREVVEDMVNLAHPTGITSQWHISPRKFVTGEPNPTPCNNEAGRTHYLLEC